MAHFLSFILFIYLFRLANISAKQWGRRSGLRLNQTINSGVHWFLQICPQTIAIKHLQPIKALHATVIATRTAAAFIVARDEQRYKSKKKILLVVLAPRVSLVWLRKYLKFLSLQLCVAKAGFVTLQCLSVCPSTEDL